MRRVRQASPVRLGEKSTSGVGLLEAEFLTAITLLILLMFASTSDSYSDKIMSVMKRGTLTCLLFFILAMIASAGPNAARFSKAFGALVIVGIVVTSPVSTILTDIDNLVKNDWTGTSETEGGTGDGGSADSGTQSSGSNPPVIGTAAANEALDRAIAQFNNSKTGIATRTKDLAKALGDLINSALGL
jgi:hypothetical protein